MQITRKDFFAGSIAVTAAAGLKAAAPNPVGKIQGFDEPFESKTEGPWQPFSDRKVRVGIAGYGVYAHLSALKGGETLKIPVFSV